MASADCTAERGWGRHDVDPAADRQRQADDLALAGAFHAEGVDGLLHEATRPVGKSPLPAATIERVVEMTLAEPPGDGEAGPG
jgi:hypothetical protein